MLLMKAASFHRAIDANAMPVLLVETNPQVKVTACRMPQRKLEEKRVARTWSWSFDVSLFSHRQDLQKRG